MKYYIYFVFILFSVLIISCNKQEPLTPENKFTADAVNSCEKCHTNYNVLKKIADPDTSSGGGGCGGDAPHFEPYDRVYLGGNGYKEFKNSTHGNIGCTYCHNGVDNTDDKKLAHSSDFIKHPSLEANKKCASCHPDIVNRTHNSIHEQGWGQKNMVTLRYGLTNGYKDYESLPAKLKTGYKDNCAKCHGTCGDCHVNRPKAGGGGLLNGHKFNKTPDMMNNCVACHTSRGGHAYLGVAAGTVPDVHKTKLNWTCLNCHDKNEIHGDGNIYEIRYKVNDLPKCTDCHQGLETKNVFHTTHYKTFDCYVCHSQDYNNCASCHVGGAGARIPSYISYKIGINPIPDIKGYKFSLVRRSLSAPDSWALYDVPNLANYDVKPNYKYTSPHNIQKKTSRTTIAEGQGCWEKCHIIKDGNTYKNKNLYLFNSDLLDWEKESTKNVVVDGKLPQSWGL